MENKNILVAGAFMGLLLSIAGNFFITSFYELYITTTFLKQLVLVDSGLGLVALVIWFSSLLNTNR